MRHGRMGYHLRPAWGLALQAGFCRLPSLHDVGCLPGGLVLLHGRGRIDKIDGSAITNLSVPLGTIMHGIYGSVPAKTVQGIAQALSRSAFPDYFLATTRAQTVTLNSGSANITSVAVTSGLGAGMPIEGIGIQAGTKIVSITSSAITMDKIATETGSRTVRVFPNGYGNGGDCTTVGVPDCLGRVVAGREGITGQGSVWLGAGSTVLGNNQGTSTTTLNVNNLPPYTPSGTITVFDPGHSHDYVAKTGDVPINSGSGSAATVGPSFQRTGVSTTGVFAGFNGIAQGGSSTPFPNVQPTLVAECVVVVQP